MEARCGGETRNFYGMGAGQMWASGKRNLEWDLNDWKWDGDLFIAKPVNPVASTNMSRQFFPVGDGVGVATGGNSSNSSSSCSEEVNLEFERSKRDLEKRRRVVLIEDDNLNEEEAGSLSLKIGGQGYPAGEREAGNWDGNGGKKSKVGGGSSRAVCQVEDCGADLSKAKDYHRRHKVCETHSKATKALVGNALQRFCQQCSRFHVLQEFDEGKRSCRRRLAGHNKRRRKTNPEAAGTVSSENNDQTSSYLLISLLRILSNMHSNKSDQPTDQELLSHHLKSLAGQSVEHGGINLSALLQSPQNLLKGSSSLANSEQDGHVHEAKAPNLPTNSRKASIPNNYPLYPEVPDSNNGQSKMNNFDLNDIYIDSDDGTEDVERSPAPANGSSSLDCPSWVQQDSHQSSPPQTSGNSDSASGQSPSSSSGDGQSRTDRIIFKLFGKEPNDFPLVVRAQILDWLAHSPTDIESYIRPGCVILTVYLRQAEGDWENLCCDLTSSLSKLLDVSDDPFWGTGWIYIRVQHQVAFVFNGQVVVDKYLPIRSCNSSKIISVKPIAIPASKKAQFIIKGINISRPSTRLLCAIEGNYLVQENNHDLKDSGDEYSTDEDVQFLNYSCTTPPVPGRGFIECMVWDHLPWFSYDWLVLVCLSSEAIEDDGFSSSFFPFIVAEEDVCSEICMLEGVLDFDETETDLEENVKMEAKVEALDFIHEIGWLLHRSQLRSRVGDLDPNTNLFPLRRLRWLIEFSMDREWCAVVKKLLNILLDGLVVTGECSTLSQALSELTLLHRAVRKNSRSLVDFLLNYVPEKSKSENRGHVLGSLMNPIFRPDAPGPAGLTPLHIAAGKDGSEDVLDSLTSDPGMVGIEAWKTARDSTGFTPEDYARLRGHYSYIHLVQKKINKRPSTRHVVLDIPGPLANSDTDKKLIGGLLPSFEIGRPAHGPVPNCKLCSQKLVSGMGRRSLAYRPAMLSMVAIAAVCVCVALLFKSYPEVVFVFRPFRWEMLDYGAS